MRYLYCILSLLAVFFFTPAKAQQPDSTTLNDTIREIVITAKNPGTTAISGYGEQISLSSRNLNKQVKVLGNADAFRYIQLLPGVATNNDFTTGTAVQGCEFSQSIVEMDGATLFYPYHLMGIFSTCNNDHFATVALEKSIHNAEFANRLGGKINILPQTEIPETFSGNIDAGLISSGATLSIPLSSKCGLILSGRLSYLNTLYSPLLEDETNRIRYDFFDTNLSFLYKIDTNNTLSVNTLLGKDRLALHSKESFLDFNLGWDNTALSATYEHMVKTISHKTNVAYSRLDNKLNIIMSEFDMAIPSKINQLSVKESAKISLTKKWTISTGAAFEYNKMRNNTGNTTGLFNDNSQPESYTEATETRISGDITYSPSEKWNICAGAKATIYNNGDYNHFSIDPCATIRYKHPQFGSMALHAGIYHQYIHQAGFSTCGLPTDFWFMSNRKLPQQKAYSITASWTHHITPLNMDFSAEVYYKRMLNQPEYNGSVMSVIYNDFNAQNNVIESNGFNTGLDVMLQKQFGKLSGWISYSLGFARRKIPGLATGYVPSTRESLHNLSITANYKHNAKFSYAANFVFASGAPTTPVESVFMIGENVLCKYGEYNSWHLPHYHRLDLSATYTFPKKDNSRYSHFLNLSIVNAYASKNVIFQYFSYWGENQTFRFKEMSTLFQLLPSISYRLEF